MSHVLRDLSDPGLVAAIEENPVAFWETYVRHVSGAEWQDEPNLTRFS